MAKATKKTVTTVTLELTEKEAQRLRRVLGGIGAWSANEQPSIDSVYEVLREVTKDSMQRSPFEGTAPKLLPED